MSEENYKKYLDILSLEELREIERHINRKQQPEKLKIVQNKIRSMEDPGVDGISSNDKWVGYPDGIMETGGDVVS